MARLYLLSPALVLLATLFVAFVVYTGRHYLFTLNRLFGRNRQPYVDVTEANWPNVIVFVDGLRLHR